MTGHDMLWHLGEGYGDAQTQIRRSRSIADALDRLGGDRMLVEHVLEYNLDGPGHTDFHRCTSIRRCLETIYESRFGSGERMLNGIRTHEDFRSVYFETMESEWGRLLHLETPEEQTERQQDERRRELEQLASGIARKHGVRCDSLEFIRIVHQEIESVDYERERWNSGERRMEEWAAHRYAGTTESYFDDLDYVNHRIGDRSRDLNDVLTWLSQTCPLLWAKWEESRLTPA